MEHLNHDEQHISDRSWKPMLHKDVDPEIMNVLKVLVDKLPQLPVHVHKLIKLASDTESDLHEVAKVAMSDPGMVSKILKAVNSSYYGLSKKTENLHLAITLLGFQEVRKVALQYGLTKVFGEGWIYKGYDTRDLWEHSYLVSICSETLVKSKNQKEAGRLLTLGILHDIGKYALYKLAVLMKKRGVRPFGRKALLSEVNLLEKEEALFGVNHTIVGDMLAQKWGLSERICAILGYHHNPSFWEIDNIPPEYLKDVVTICISDFIVRHLDGKSKQLPEPAPEYFDILDLTLPLDNIITTKLLEKIEDAKDFVSNIK